MADKSMVCEIATSSNKGLDSWGSGVLLLATSGPWGSGSSMLAIKGLLSSILSTVASL